MLGYSSVGVESVIPDSIVVAENIMPSEAMLLFRKKIKALVLQEGGVSSHISILARTYGIPSVFGVENPTSSIETGNTIVVDATKSLVIVEPDKSIRTDYHVGGSQREDDYDKLVARIKELGMNPEDYSWYLNLRKYGGTTHSGFGLGFERMIMYLTGVANIRDVLPFPRTVSNLEY